MKYSTAYKIIKIDHEFDGIIKTEEDSFLKVPFTLENEIVKINKVSSKYSDDYTLIDSSPKRKSPICEYFGICGGCKAQHWDHQSYLLHKKQNFIDLLNRMQVVIEKRILDQMEVIHHLDDPLQKRRKASFKVHKNTIGFFAYKSHKLVPIKKCPLMKDMINQFLKDMNNVLKSAGNIFPDMEIKINFIKNQLDVLIIAKKKLHSDIILALSDLFSKDYISQIYWQINSNQEPILIRNKLYSKYGVPISSGGFIQPSDWGEDNIHQFIISTLKNNKQFIGKEKIKIIDLFCGVGNYIFEIINNYNNLFQNNSHLEIIGADIVMTYVNKKNDKYNLEFQKRDLFKNPMSLEEVNNTDIMIINPPRKGAMEQINIVAKSNVKVLILIYCSFSSCIRDLKIIMNSQKFDIEKIQILDQFIFSHHCEVMVYLKSK